ncbi:hypothetical protein CY34DRAFT_120031 [Suillus luteus UH-Slu-Lm8-n1]|uniref:Unplaced genomic scaffold CY34scaffold_1, whole genome shotgun sequence n=1 Tax=Suillus luteus UH-Slu-Lm8-n1 TaxID=930992 RepID=A0A0D0BJA3_9AGAM|nr:hypothetical protein CY34DRAFT_120031 [Suillus luteus UH-Slu-Lm8-n1]
MLRRPHELRSASCAKRPGTRRRPLKFQTATTQQGLCSPNQTYLLSSPISTPCGKCLLCQLRQDSGTKCWMVVYLA